MSKRQALSVLPTVILTTVLAALPGHRATAEQAPPPGELKGHGSLEGTERVLDEEFTGSICFRATKSIFALRGVGTYHGQTAEGQEVVYRGEISAGETLYGNGPLHVEVENTETYYHGPQGTHGTSDASCSPPTAGSAVPAVFRIFAADHVYRLDGSENQLPCTGTGTFARTDQADNPNWTAQWTLDTSCTVVGNEAGTPGTGVAPAGTAHTHDGLHAPCFNPPCTNNIRVGYSQYLPLQGFRVKLTGPATAQVGTAVTVTATVTNDGQPVANAAVTFSVAGPAPSAPPIGAAATGADGRASFTFTAPVAGDYNVNASATNTTETASAAHLVTIISLPPPTLTLEGPAEAQTEEPVVVSATFTNAGQPVPGATIEFAATAAGLGQATPTSGTATTDANGKASFTFTGNRADSYTVTATGTLGGETAAASHTVHLEINTFHRVGNIALESADGCCSSAVMDSSGEFAYFAGGKLVKVDLNPFQRVGAVPLSGNAALVLMDPGGQFAYVGINGGGGVGGKVVKVDLSTFQQVDQMSLGPKEDSLDSAVVDPAGGSAYFAVHDSGVPVNPGAVVKVDLSGFQRVGALSLDAGETSIPSAVMHPAGRHAYFGVRGQGQSPAKVIKVDVSTFERVGTISLQGEAENWPRLAIIDPTGDDAYFAMQAAPGRVVKVDLSAFARVGATSLESSDGRLVSGAIEPRGKYAYFGTSLQNGAGRVIKIDLEEFQRAHAIDFAADERQNSAAAIDPQGKFAYFDAVTPAALPAGSISTPVPKVVKFAISRPPVAWLAASDDSYPTPFATPLSVPAPGVLANDEDTEDGDALGANLVDEPAHGTVALNRDGSFTYTPESGFSGADTFTYKVDDGMDYSAPATVTVNVEAPPEGVQAVDGSAFGFYTNVGLFGGPQAVRGGYGSTCGQEGQPACADGQSPAVELPPSGGDLSATDPDGNVGVYGPARIFENHGPLTVSAQGTTGPGGSVTASASVAAIQDNDPFHAHAPDGEASSTCTASESGLSGSTRVVNGRLVVHTDPETGEPTEQITFPPTWDPAPNTVYEGALDHVGDNWRIVFNEHVLAPDSITVNAVHLYLLGPTAVGDMIVGQSHCALTQAAANAAPTAGDDAYTATGGQALTVAAPGLLANDADPEGGPLRAGTLAPLPPPTSGGGAWTFPSDPAHGTLRLGADGSFTYTADDGFVGTDSFPYLVHDGRGAADEGTVTITVEAPPPGLGAVVDFDGDDRSDLGLYRPSTGAWYLRQSTAGDSATPFGANGDRAVPADYDGDGTVDTAVYRPSTGVWYLRQSTAGDASVRFGASGDVPVPADYDGDGQADVGVFRPSTGAWYLRQSTAGESALTFGTNGDIPVVGDYDGDGQADVGVFRPSTGVWYLRQSVAGNTSVTFGTNGDIPVVGDYDGDGQADVGVFRPSTGAWYLRQSNSGDTAVTFGSNGDIPAPADYDGDGKADVGVFRPSTGVWYLRQSTAGDTSARFGANGDVPLSLPAAIRQSMGLGG